MPGDILTMDEIAEAGLAMKKAEEAVPTPPSGPGVTVTVGDIFPWKRAWWRVVAVCKFRDDKGVEQQGVVIAPEKFTGALKRQKGRK